MHPDISKKARAVLADTGFNNELVGGTLRALCNLEKAGLVTDVRIVSKTAVLTEAGYAARDMVRKP